MSIHRTALWSQFAPTFHRPFLRYIEGEQGGGAGGAEGGEADAPKFPANTPVKDMTPEQQAAYHLHQARKHEDRWKAFGEWTPDKIRALEQERDGLKTKTQTAEQNAIDAAREEGRNEIRQVLNVERATAALKDALKGRVPDAGALLGLDVSAKFLRNGVVDQDAVKAWVDANSTEAGAPQKRNPDVGAGHRGTSGDAGKGVSAGRDLFADRHKKKTTS